MTGCVALFAFFVLVIGGLLNCLIFFPIGFIWGVPLFLMGVLILLAIAKGAKA